MRHASTYRGSRRNAALRGDSPEVWGPGHYFEGHDPSSGSRGHRLRKKGRKVVRVGGKAASPLPKRVGTRPAINKAAPRGQ